MDPDPWNWGVAETQQFFRQDARRYLSDRLGAVLPPTATFVQALHDNDVDGPSLLDTVDPAMLRSELGISSVRHRGAIMHCIRKLRQQSHGHRASQSIGPRLQTPPSLLATPRQPAALLPSTEVDGVGQNVRTGEAQTEDAHGRKRRKLDLTKDQADETSLQVSGYLPDSALSIDEIFYGPTSVGREIGTLALTSKSIAQDPDPETAEQSFSFFHLPIPNGHAKFAWKRLRHFLSSAETIDVRRHGRDALAILPYPERLAIKGRSATVVQAKGQSTSEYVAVRERVSMIHSVEDPAALHQEPPTEFGEHLLKRWAQKEDEEVLGGSEGADDATELASAITDDDRAGSESEAEEVDEQTLEKARIAEIIDEEIERCTLQWQEQKLPKLEAEKAWSVWKQTRQSLSLRDTLVQNAQAQIQHLTQRLSDQRAAYLADEWASGNVLRRMCHNLQVTIEDREMRLWKVSVWRRRKEPAHVVKHKATATTAAKNEPTAAASKSLAFRPDIDDLMDVSPTAAAHVEVVARAVQTSNHDREDFFTPGNSPSHHTPSNGDFVVSDPISEDGDGPEHPSDSDVEDNPEDKIAQTFGQSTHLANGFTSSPPAQSSARSQRSHESIPTGTQDLRRVGNAMSSEHELESEGDLPSPSSFIKPRASTQLKETQQNPTKAGPYGISTEPIEISSDSADRASSPIPMTPKTKKAKTPKRTNRGLSKKPQETNFTSNADDANGDEVDSWDLKTLQSRNDRQRILIKLLKEAGAETRERLHQCLLDQASPETRLHQLLAAIRTRISGDPEAEDLDSKNSEVMMFCTGLAMTLFMATEPGGANAQLPWKGLLDDEWQLEQFITLLMSILRRKGSWLFRNRSERSRLSEEIEILISSDDDDAMPEKGTRHKKRKRMVKESVVGVRARQLARERHDQYTEKVESQPLNSSQMEAAPASSASRSEVLINPGHEDAPIYINPRIAKQMKAHQIDGVRFMWREITALAEEEEGGQGCLLAHTMGLGKTMQTIAILAAVIEVSESRDRSVRRQLPASLRPKGIRNVRQLRILILCPPALLLNWRSEIQQWAPDALGNIFAADATAKGANEAILDDWYKVGGVLLIGFHRFRGYLARKSENPNDVQAARSDRMEQVLLEGPEVVVCDEAHNLKNEGSVVTRLANGFATHTRIGLTGTPMSNDVQEIFSLVSFVAPGYLGDRREFRAKFAEPIEQGTYFESTKWEVRKSLMKLKVLQHEIEPKVHRADITALKGSLKPKIEFVITVSLTESQTTVYNRYVVALVGGGRNEKASQVTIFGWLATLMLLTNHPTAFRRKLLTPPSQKSKKKSKAKRDMSPEAEDVTGAATPDSFVSAEVAREQGIDAAALVAPGDEDVYALGFTEEQVQDIVRDVDYSLDAALSAKTSILMNILKLSEACGDQVLLFSHSIPTLDFLTKLLESKGVAFGRVDGQVNMQKRTELIDEFNRSKFNVLLVSTRAGGTGLNIQAANRVIIFDFSFNPAWEQQAVGRAYRFGQTKPVFVYRFVAGGTFESTLYNTQLFKTGLSTRVVDKKNPRRNAQRHTKEYLYHPKPVPEEDLQQWIGKDPNVLDKLLVQHGVDKPGKVDTMMRSIQTMEVLQEEQQDEPLNENERKEVEEEIAQNMMIGRGGMRRKTMADGLHAATNGLAGRTAMMPPPPSARPAATQFQRSSQTSPLNAKGSQRTAHAGPSGLSGVHSSAPPAGEASRRASNGFATGSSTQAGT